MPEGNTTPHLADIGTIISRWAPPARLPDDTRMFPSPVKAWDALRQPTDRQRGTLREMGMTPPPTFREAWTMIASVVQGRISK